jgi:hypothetical protein
MNVWPLRRRRASCQVAASAIHRALEDQMLDASIYRDGTYLISEWGEARTWAVHRRGRWGVVYEWLGEQPLAGWVSADQIPLEVRALALNRTLDEAR